MNEVDLMINLVFLHSPFLSRCFCDAKLYFGNNPTIFSLFIHNKFFNLFSFELYNSYERENNKQEKFN